MNENVFVQPETEKNPINFATIAAIYSDGVSLVFDGETAPSEKHYLVNAFIKFAVGQRVRIIADSGTYVVEYPVGTPISSFAADTATNANSANSANSAANATNAQNAVNATTAAGVNNTGTTYSDVQFRMLYSNQLQYRLKNGTWYTVQNA